MNAIPGALRAIAAWNSNATHAPPPPAGAHPARYGHGRVELLIHPGATEADRIAGAVTLLAGTPFHVSKRLETTTP
jgi:hypothetical protein